MKSFWNSFEIYWWHENELPTWQVQHPQHAKRKINTIRRYHSLQQRNYQSPRHQRLIQVTWYAPIKWSGLKRNEKEIPKRVLQSCNKNPENGSEHWEHYPRNQRLSSPFLWLPSSRMVNDQLKDIDQQKMNVLHKHHMRHENSDLDSQTQWRKRSFKHHWPLQNTNHNL